MADNVNRLLIVDEDGAVVDFVGKVAKRVGYAVATATCGWFLSRRSGLLR